MLELQTSSKNHVKADVETAIYKLVRTCLPFALAFGVSFQDPFSSPSYSRFYPFSSPRLL
jgi:Sec-independent protein secretion pathway component TatC